MFTRKGGKEDEDGERMATRMERRERDEVTVMNIYTNDFHRRCVTEVSLLFLLFLLSFFSLLPLSRPSGDYTIARAR